MIENETRGIIPKIFTCVVCYYQVIALNDRLFNKHLVLMKGFFFFASGFVQLIDALSACTLSNHLSREDRTWAVHRLAHALSHRWSLGQNISITGDEDNKFIHGLPVDTKCIRAHEKSVHQCSWNSYRKCLATTLVV